MHHFQNIHDLYSYVWVSKEGLQKGLALDFEIENLWFDLDLKEGCLLLHKDFYVFALSENRRGKVNPSNDMA